MKSQKQKKKTVNAYKYKKTLLLFCIPNLAVHLVDIYGSMTSECFRIIGDLKSQVYRIRHNVCACT